MLNPSLLDILRKNQKVDIEEFPSAVAIKTMIGFIKRNNTINPFEEIKNNPNSTREDIANAELAEVYLPALLRFKEGEIMEIFAKDIESILEYKEKKGLT